MNYNIIEDYTKIDKIKWLEFVIGHSEGNIFQTPYMFETYRKTKKYTPVIIAITKPSGDVLGILLAVIQKEFKGVIGHFTARSIIFGGPIVINNDVTLLEVLLKAYNKKINQKAIYSQIRNMKECSELINIFFENGFEFEDHLNIMINLNKSEDQLWNEVHSKRRNEIRRAKKEGTIFVVKNNMYDLQECYLILRSVYKRAKLPIPSFTYFENLYLNANNNIGLRIFCAENQGKIIGCMLALVYQKTIYDYYAGAYKEYYKKYPNDLIPWEVFIYGKKNNFTFFDFGGAGKPNIPYGVREYKKKFGGELINFGRFEQIHKPMSYKLIKLALELRKVFK